MKKNSLVLGAGGFIGHHLVNRLKKENYYVVAADLKKPRFEDSSADSFFIGDLRDPSFCETLFEDNHFDEIYQLAADMGGAGYIFTGDSDADIMHNSALININILNLASIKKSKKIFYSSSACIYPEYNQLDPENPKCDEDSAYPAEPDSEYGWEKLFSERLYFSYERNKNLEVRVARFHNIYGPLGSWNDGKEKAPAAICRKVAEAKDGEEIEIWGDGKQTRSFLYIDDCLDAVKRFMDSDWSGPVNIGSEEMVTINKLGEVAKKIACKELGTKNIPGPTGVRGRNSDNDLIKEKLQWQPKYSLEEGISKTYKWIEQQVNNS
tara:strand:+ start:1534 stop:2502 length:969 start_codon:yes stop_codon:yes gene_type:complete